MAYYQTCPECGAHLDPGEHCECERVNIAAELTALDEIVRYTITEKGWEYLKGAGQA